ncbi:GNAT family N-acetyltransferase [uncultured Pelagimonas sp.]|uniref:GNAT family N-acetyltransferase n=1 Tax=uncultured Pelagimonas sp. TaxID=1618102 RepID=UPI002609F52B|nr:GNAT family N-acetyltransferase [uncultured Pelagimonas sp.]
MPAPILDTPRLRLRPHVMSDMDAFATFFEGTRADHLTKPQNTSHLWYIFTSEVGSWELIGIGGWAIETRDGQLIGQVAITQPPHFDEREIGWILFDGFEGQGYALEAATAALHWAWEQDMQTLVSYIEKDNTRSIALAERLGAVLDPAAQVDEDDALVYRHSPDIDGNPEAYA